MTLSVPDVAPQIVAWSAFYAASLVGAYQIGYDSGYSAGIDYCTMAADMLLDPDE